MDAFIPHKQKWDLCKGKEGAGALVFLFCGCNSRGFRDSLEGLSELSKIACVVMDDSDRIAVKVSEGEKRWGSTRIPHCPHGLSGARGWHGLTPASQKPISVDGLSGERVFPWGTGDRCPVASRGCPAVPPIPPAPSFIEN